MSEEPPAWKVSNPQASLRQRAEWLNEEARRTFLSEEDHTLTQLMMGEMAVSDLKKGDREEALMVRVESRNGLNHLWLSPIVRKGEEVALAEPMEMSEELSGRFGSLF